MDEATKEKIKELEERLDGHEKIHDKMMEVMTIQQENIKKFIEFIDRK